MYSFFVKKYLLCFFLSLGFIVVFNYAVDPYQYYRYNKNRVLCGDDRWQVAGFIKNFPYNQVIVGTSMTQNFSLAQIKSVLGTEPIRLSLAGATMQEQAVVLNAAISTKKVKSVIWGLDRSYLYYQPGVYPNSFPKHIYTTSYKAHFQYLLNSNVFQNSQKVVKRAIFKKPTQLITLEDYNVWFKQYVFSKKEVMKQFEESLSCLTCFPPEITTVEMEAQSADAEPINNFNHDILPIIQENLNIHFIIFLPPYSLAQHKLTALSKEKKNKELKLRDYLIQTLTKYANVSLYDFETFLPVVANLNNYKDVTHYSEKINNFMVQSFLTDNCKVTKENADLYQQKFLTMDKMPFVE